MNRSWRVARIANIDVSLHWSFLLLVGWVGFAAYTGGGFAAAASEVLFVLALFACVVLHEFGHSAAAAIFGIPTHGITLLPIGGVAQLDRIPRKPWQELIIALAGPAVNVLIVGLLLPALIVSQAFWPGFEGSYSLLQRLVWTNVSLVLFNLLPAFPMDGGRVLRALLARRGNYLLATRIAKWVGGLVAFGFAVVGFYWNPLLILVALFVAMAAESEYQQVKAETRQTPLGQVSASLDSTRGSERMLPGPVSPPRQIHAVFVHRDAGLTPQVFYFRQSWPA